MRPRDSLKKWPGQRKLWAGKIDEELLLMLNDGNCKLDKVSPQDVHCRMFLYHLDLKLEQILSHWIFHRRTFLYDLSGNPGLQNSSGQSSLHLVCQVSITAHSVVGKSIEHLCCYRLKSRSQLQLWKGEVTAWCSSSAGAAGYPWKLCLESLSLLLDLNGWMFNM